jgi:glycosyltransferase involved in cell wall biosynthesis
MRIAVVQDFLRMGGTERQSVLLANAYAAAGHETQLLIFRPGGPLAADISPRVQHVVLQARDRGVDWWAPRLTRTLRDLRPDIVQLMGRTVQILGWNLSRAIPSARFVATFRTGKTIPWLHRLTLHRAHAIVVNSREARDRLARNYGETGPQVRIIRNAVAAPALPPADARHAVRRELGTAPGTTVFLCTAMLRPEKGHRELVHAAAELKLEAPWEMWLAGEGVELEPCRALAHELGMQDRVRFLGLRHDVARLYAAADVAVLTSRSESLPNFLVEAQWLGLPVVATDIAGVGETFAPGASGVLVAHGDRAGFCAALRHLAGNPALRSRMSAAARVHAVNEFDPARQNERYLELFAELMGTTRL